METGIELIAQERREQIEKHGYDNEHDDLHTAFQLSSAAGVYISRAHNDYFKDHTHYDGMGNVARFQIRKQDTKQWVEGWPWIETQKDDQSILKMLVIAGALIAAEIDRLQAQEGGQQ